MLNLKFKWILGQAVNMGHIFYTLYVLDVVNSEKL